MANRTKVNRKSKSHQKAKPYPEFPLTAHAAGRWCKKLKGRRYYFGKVSDGWESALKQYEYNWPHILEHGQPRPDDPQLTPGDVADFKDVQPMARSKAANCWRSISPPRVWSSTNPI